MKKKISGGNRFAVLMNSKKKQIVAVHRKVVLHNRNMKLPVKRTLMKTTAKMMMQM